MSAEKQELVVYRRDKSLSLLIHTKKVVYVPYVTWIRPDNTSQLDSYPAFPHLRIDLKQERMGMRLWLIPMLYRPFHCIITVVLEVMTALY